MSLVFDPLLFAIWNCLLSRNRLENSFLTATI